MLVGFVDVVDQAFVQRPGVHLAFPVVDDGVAEAEGFALQVRYARGDPGFFGCLQGFVVGLGQERVDCGLQGLGGAQRVAVHGVDQLGVMLDHGFAGGFVDSPGRRSGGAGGSRCLGLRRGGLVVLAFTATGESDGNGQQTGGGQRHSNHYWFSCVVWLDQGVDRAPWHAKPQHHAKDLHLL
ncbi:hypothetical protein D3C75_889640 [compost metagenome]